MARAAACFVRFRQVIRSELAWRDRVAYLMDRVAERWRSGVAHYQLRTGDTVRLRRGSTDFKVFDEVFLEQIYAAAADLFGGNRARTILIDLGANIGLSTVFLTRRLRPLRVVAVEPCPENFRLLLKNTQGFAERCTAIQAFVGAERGFAELLDVGFGAWGLRMGAPADRGTRVLPLAEIVPRVPGTRVFLKCDIEGTERHLFHTMHEWEHLVDFIVLELHTELFSAIDLDQCLSESAFEWARHGTIHPNAVLAVIGLERGRGRDVAAHRDLYDLYNEENDSRNSARGAAAM